MGIIYLIKFAKGATNHAINVKKTVKTVLRALKHICLITNVFEGALKNIYQIHRSEFVNLICAQTIVSFVTKNKVLTVEFAKES